MLDSATSTTLDEDAAVARLMRMMAIPGASGDEGRILAFITDQLLAAGVPEKALTTDTAHHRSPRGGETGNLILKLPGTKRAPRRLMMAHVDTVPLCVGCEPLLEGDTIRSANPATALGGDDRAGAGVVLTAVLELVARGLPHPPLTCLWAVQEEIGLCGVRYLVKSKLGNPKHCFNWDGTDAGAIAIGATGDDAIEIEVTGLASHAGAAPEQGVNAITIASVAIADLHENGWLGAISKGRRRGTSNIGVIEGGAATNVVTPSVRLRAEARSHDAKFRAKIVEAIRKAFVKAAKSVRSANGDTGAVHFDAQLKYEAFALDRKDPTVALAERAVRAEGLEPTLGITNGGLDANWMVAHGFPTVTLGCGQHAIHTVDEWLHVPTFLEACRIGLRIATDVS